MMRAVNLEDCIAEIKVVYHIRGLQCFVCIETARELVKLIGSLEVYN